MTKHFLSVLSHKKTEITPMKIKYLKDAPTANVGDVADVIDNQALVLIRLGIAEAYSEPKRKKTTSKAKASD